MALNVLEQNSTVGDGSTSMVLAHGFTQNSNCWASFSTRLAATHRLKLVDMPGHGQSEHDHADLSASGDLLAEAGGEAAYIGYSMGGRIALHTALQHPSKVSKLVLIGVNPGLDTADEQQQRRRLDAALAGKIQNEGLDTFLQGWLANPLFAGLPDEAACMADRLTNRVTGLVATLETRSVGWQIPLWGRLEELTMPVLLIAGQTDTKYRQLNERAAVLIPNSETRVVDGSHAVHLQRPKTVADIVSQFVTS